jgi:hypothetical protein
MKHPAFFCVKSGPGYGLCLVLCALSGLGCGDGDERPQVTTIATPDDGGVSGGPLGDTLTVYALDANSGLPIANAYVSLGAGQAAHRIGQTGSDGRLVASSLAGTPQMVSVSAPGYAAATWGLVKSAVVRIPLEAVTDPAPEATVALTVPGWNDLPALPEGSYRIARFAFARPRGLDTLEATLASAGPECLQAQTATDCAVTLSVPAGSSSLLAVIAEGRDAGTPKDRSDDILAVTALGIQTGLELHEGARTELSLPLLDHTSVAPATLVTTAPRSGQFQDVIGVPGVSLDGQILLYPSLGPLATSFLVPTATGPFVNAKLWAVGTADKGNDAAWSRVYERGIDPPKSESETIDLTTSAFIDSPSCEKIGPNAYALSSEGNLTRLEIATPNGEQLNVLLFPAQSEFEIPAGVLSQEPSSVTVESFDLELDSTAFDFADLARQSTRIAYFRNDAL